MRYSSARSFRQALEDRLRSEYASNKIPRLRKMIAFERFMARLDNRWILKGGYALQLRTDKARTTQDVDLLAQHISDEEISQGLSREIRHEDIHTSFGTPTNKWIFFTNKQLQEYENIKYSLFCKLSRLDNIDIVDQGVLALNFFSKSLNCKVDEYTKMGIVSKVKYELRQAQALKINYSSKEAIQMFSSMLMTLLLWRLITLLYQKLTTVIH